MFCIVNTERKAAIRSVADQCRVKVVDLVMSDSELSQLTTTEGTDQDQETAVDAAICALGHNKWIFEGVHVNDLQLFQGRCDALETETESRRHELSSTGAEIARLWTLLRIPSSEREAFQASFKMNLSADTISTGHAELKRLHVVRASSMDRVIHSIRSDIAGLWKEMGIEAEEDRAREFAIYYESIEEMDDTAVRTHTTHTPHTPHTHTAVRTYIYIHTHTAMFIF